MRKKVGCDRVPLCQVLWVACVALGAGILLCLLLEHLFWKWMLGTILIAVGLWRLLQ